MSDTYTDDEVLSPDQEQALHDQELDDLAPELNETTQSFVDKLVARILLFIEEALLGHKLFPYQRVVAARVIESVIINDGEEITVLQSRQSGKTEALAAAIGGMMILLPRLAKAYPDLLGKFKAGFWVGVFAPVETQAETIFQRVTGVLTNDTAIEVMLDPEINDMPTPGGGKFLKLRNSGSYCRQQTAHPKAKIESKSYHFILIDEAQDANDRVISKSINPMLAFYNGTKVMTGTATRFKGYFYRAIQRNKRRQTRRGSRQNHFEYDWRACARANPDYRKYVAREKVRLGEDSDDFRMSYELVWMLDKGLFAAQGNFNAEAPEFLGDRSMQVQPTYYRTPVVFGCDPAREHDSTVVTAVWVNWDWEDPTGLREHRVLDWLEIEGEDWESQYRKIVQFCAGYNGWAMAVDSTGMGDAVAERLAVMMPRLEVIKSSSNRAEQSKRWKHLRNVMQRKLFSFPAHAYTRRLRRYRRFAQQMDDLELVYTGPYLMAAAPDEADAHDDYPDSLALGVSLTLDTALPEVETYTNPFHQRRRR